MRNRSDSPTKTCTEDGCDNPLRAKGLCSTHYNKTQANRYTLVTKACDGCGQDVTRERRTRGASTHCSELCRQWAQFGAWSSTLPHDHWARMYGATCAVAIIAPRTFTCEWCGTQCITTKDATRFCSRDHQGRAKRVRRRGREFNAIGTFSWAEVTRLWLAFDRSCAYCRTALALADVQAEHVTPLARGGANNLTNLLPSCGTCNSDKRDLTLSHWATDRARRHLPAVITAWADDDMRYSHLTTGRTLVRMSG